MSIDLNLECFWAEMNDGITPRSIIDSIYTQGHRGATLVRGFSPIRLLLVWEPFYSRKFKIEMMSLIKHKEICHGLAHDSCHLLELGIKLCTVLCCIWGGLGGLTEANILLINITWKHRLLAVKLVTKMSQNVMKERILDWGFCISLKQCIHSVNTGNDVTFMRSGKEWGYMGWVTKICHAPGLSFFFF